MPTTSPIYAHSADAFLMGVSDVFGTFAQARGGNSPAKTDQARYYGAYIDYNVGYPFSYAVGRGFLCFDLGSVVPSGATITAVDLYVYVYGASGADGGSVQLVESTQASATALSTSDWSAVGSTDLATAKTFASLTTGAYNTFSLNAAGLTAANSAISSYLKLAFRASKDVSNTAPTDRSYMGISYSDQTGTSEDPYIVVTYTGGTTPAQISGSSSAAATGSLSLGTGGPATITPNASNAQATASLALTANASLGSLSSTATASGSLTLETSSAVGVRAAPGWLGLFVTDTGGSPIPTIDGSSNAVATGSLSLVVPARAPISGTSQAVAVGSLTIRAGLTTYIATPTSIASAQFGTSVLSSDQAGNSVLVPAEQHQIS